jgi:predicted permease
MSSWRALATLDPGFHRNGILLVRADIHQTNTPPEQRVAYFTRALDCLRAIPGVRGASVSMMAPIGAGRWNNTLHVDGFTRKSVDDANAWMNAVSDGYFTTLGIPLRQGRDFTTRDDATTPRVAIVSEAMARHFFNTPSVIGKRFREQDGPGLTPPIEIVGVVGDAKYTSLRASAEPVVYYPQAQEYANTESRSFELRTDGAPLSVMPSVKSIMAELSPKIALQPITLEQQLDNTTAVTRTVALLSGFFGALALVLATIGLYGVMSYNVARRRNEIGIRIALGAEYGRVVRMVLGDVGRIVLAGVVIGILVSAGATRLVTSFLCGVTPSDPATFALSAAILFAVGMCAAALPARRAARLDAMAALREE